MVEEGLFRLISGTFSFCAAVSIEMELDDVVIPDDDDADAGVSVFFCGCCCCCCCFFFFPALEDWGLALRLGAEFEGLDVKVEGLLLPPLTVSREEISNMVGTARNSCCVIPPVSSSEDGGDRAGVGFAFSPPFFFLREEEEEEEEERS